MIDSCTGLTPRGIELPSVAGCRVIKPSTPIYRRFSAYRDFRQNSDRKQRIDWFSDRRKGEVHGRLHLFGNRVRDCRRAGTGVVCGCTIRAPENLAPPT